MPLALLLAVALHSTHPVATILCYHEVDDASAAHATIPRLTASGDTKSEQLRYTASPAQFEEELEFIAANHYNVIPLADLVDFLHGKRDSLPEHAVVITVDDGWLCASTEILPALRKRGWPWTLFVYPKIVGRGSHALTWAQIEELARDGVDVESHTYTHPFLTKSTDLDHELIDSKREIESHTHTPVRFLCYPFGDYNAAVIDAATRAGYEAGLTTTRGPIAGETSPMELKRYLIHNDTTLADLKTFLVQDGNLIDGFSSRAR